MAVRNIVKIDEEKCNGCGLCVTACAEGAIQIIDGKAILVSEVYCDGLGACLGHCPEDAISIEKRESAEFDEEAVKQHLVGSEIKTDDVAGFVCPGSKAMKLQNKNANPAAKSGDVSSQLGQWPVQFSLISPDATYFKNADLLVVADCVPFAMGDFHQKLLKNRAIAVGCPKLDNVQPYVEKLAEIIKLNNLRSLTVVHMMVPCCSGLVRVVQEAVRLSGKEMDYEDITINLDGTVMDSI
jgi:Fe-S-cluster-containing hydrogenase component 2